MKIFKWMSVLLFVLIIGCNSDGKSKKVEQPAVDITGYWAVESIQNGEAKVGMSYYLTMEPDGTFNGKAKLSSLPGESVMTGKLEGYEISIKCISEYGTLYASGSVDNTGSNLSGTFSVAYTDGTKIDDVEFSGIKVPPANTSIGTYTYTPVNSEDLTLDLSLTMTSSETDIVYFDVRGITSDTMILWDNYGNEVEWTRLTGTGDSLLGTWERGTINEMERITFNDDNSFTYEHIVQFYLNTTT